MKLSIKQINSLHGLLEYSNCTKVCFVDNLKECLIATVKWSEKRPLDLSLAIYWMIKKKQDDLWHTDGIFIGNLVHSETQMD